jgi:glycosyltransferase involved in cell wall biosynthesis
MTDIRSCSIVLPCYNPQPGWADNVVVHYRQIEQRLNLSIQLIIVNDGSTTGVDDTEIDLLVDEPPHFHYMYYPANKGKGYALRQGVAAAHGDIIIYTDVDFPYTVESLVAVAKALIDEGNDIAVGVKDATYYNNIPPARKYISRVLRMFIGIFFNVPFTDTQCGLKGFNAVGKKIFLQTKVNRYLFDLEFVKYAGRSNVKIKPVVVKLRDTIVFRKMNYKLILPEMLDFIRILFMRNNS